MSFDYILDKTRTDAEDLLRRIVRDELSRFGITSVLPTPVAAVSVAELRKVLTEIKNSTHGHGKEDYGKGFDDACWMAVGKLTRLIGEAVPARLSQEEQ